MSNPLADVEKFLEETPPFDLLDAQLRHRAAAAIEAVYRRTGSVMLEVGDHNDTLYVIRRGADASGKALDEAQVQQRTIALRCLVDGAILNWIRDPAMDPQQLRRSLYAVCDTLRQWPA